MADDVEVADDVAVEDDDVSVDVLEELLLADLPFSDALLSELVSDVLTVSAFPLLPDLRA